MAMQVNVHDSILLHLQSIPLFLCHQKKLTSDTFELLLLLIVLRCTGGVSTFSLSILNVSRISSSRKHCMVSSRLELSMFLASTPKGHDNGRGFYEGTEEDKPMERNL